MAKPKGLEWNQEQLKIAYHLQKGLLPKEMATKYGFSVSTCYHIKKKMDAGDNPGEVTQEMINKAPPPSAHISPKYALSWTMPNGIGRKF